MHYSNEFFTALKDYLPVFAALVTLTSAGVFGFILKNIKGSKELPNTDALLKVISVKEKFKSDKKTMKLNETRINNAIYLLSQKSIKEIEEIATHDKYLGDQIMRDIGGMVLVGVVILAIELVLYASLISGIVSGNYCFFFVFMIVFSLYFFWKTRGAKRHS